MPIHVPEHRSTVRFAVASLLLLGLTAAAAPAAPPVELLWPDGAPGRKGISRPTSRRSPFSFPISKKRPERPWSSAPAGATADWPPTTRAARSPTGSTSFGVAGFMLEYRHRGRGYGHPAPLQDAQRAIRTVRARAAEWKIDPQKNRHHGLFRRRTPGLDGRHAFRPGQTPARPTHRARQLPARLPDPLLCGDRLRRAVHPSRLAG